MLLLRKSDVPINQKWCATCFVEVLKDPLRTFKEVEDGQGTLTIVGSLENKQGRDKSIPEKFRAIIIDVYFQLK